MKKDLTQVVIFIIGILLISCNPRKGLKNASENKSINQSIKVDGNANNFIDQKKNTDSVPKYNPDERENQNTFEGVFAIPELYVAPSPDKSNSILLNQSENLIDFDIAPTGLIVAAIISDVSNENFIKFWNISQEKFFDEIKFPKEFSPKSITWHPQSNAIFILALKGEQSTILRFEKESTGWKSESIFSTNAQIRRLIACPRPFKVFYDYKLKRNIFSYRLFFGLQKPDNSFRIASITEYGKKFYQVIGPSATFTHAESEEIDPSKMEAGWALPIAFHPSGENLIWNDLNGNFFVARYISKFWGDYKPILNGKLKGGTITPTPNGLGLLHWQKNKPGIGFLLLSAGTEEQLLTNNLFLTTPSSVPDGKGIVGLTMVNNCFSLNYIPIKIPQADVVNAWMFSETKEDLELFTKNFGLFRILNDEQLYNLYESENYYCNDYDETTPTRPYNITTDIFWELFGSAFQGIFTIKERSQAIPAFWNFVNSANSYFKKSSNQSPWVVVFDALTDLQKGKSQNPETNRILNCKEKTYSETLKQEFDYSQLKPRGFYTSTTQMQVYFKAFQYLTRVYENNKIIVGQLNNLPQETKQYALTWIDSYNGFVSPPRRQNVFYQNDKSIPKYVQFPDTGMSVFPLSWGFDNEALNSVVFHSTYPMDKQIISTTGDIRLLPSGLDIAAALSNNFSASLMDAEYKKYPNLRPAIDNLRKNYKTNGKENEDNNLYDRWVNALTTQWIDTLHSTNGEDGNNIWQTKRLQTGLASWATLRHATVLVNETGAAECGEAGFEEILMRAPRGYVEPDPYTFRAIADLFESAIDYVPKTTEGALYEGITIRLRETANKTRMFQAIAEKEIKGEPITNEEYEAILYVARVVEHNFLIFKSLANEEYALSKPDPIPKITNVFGKPETSYLMAAVGRPMEWDFTVPFYGRHQVVKGSVYSYYEFVSNRLINDKEWIGMINSQDFLPWIKPYVSKQNISYPPQSGY
jgi:hypothetical protein